MRSDKLLLLEPDEVLGVCVTLTCLYIVGVRLFAAGQSRTDDDGSFGTVGGHFEVQRIFTYDDVYD